VSVGETVLAPQSIAKGQRTILIVYPAPAPWVITESESKAEAAAKMLPVFSYVATNMQEDRFKTASATLNKYVPRWPARDLLEAALLKELPKTDFAGHFIPVAEADPDTTTLRSWNRSTDVLDWQNRYLTPDPNLPEPRDYSRYLPWDDALALEVNLLPLLAADDDGNMVPTLSATSRLYRCQTMHLLWQHDDKVDDPSSARTLYEFETLPQQLVDRWQALVPALAAKISGSLTGALHPVTSTNTAPGGMAPAPSTGTGSFPLPPAASSATAAAPAVTAPAGDGPPAAQPAAAAPKAPAVAAPAGDGPPAPQPALPAAPPPPAAASVSTATATTPAGDGPPAPQPAPKP
jgi:hypothetical protein